jgi:c-di-AMP phosphodiesterase-like protein
MATPKKGSTPEDPKVSDLVAQAKLLESQVAVAELRARLIEANVRARKAAAELLKMRAETGA